MPIVRSLIGMLLFSFASMPAWGVTFTGRVMSDKGRPVPGVKVSVQATVATVANGVATQPPSFAVLTDNQGIFSVNLPVNGTYSVCAGSFSHQLLNSCEWAFAQSVFKVPQPTAAPVVITLQTGIPLTIRLDDMSSLLPKLGASGKAQVSIGLTAGTAGYHGAALVSADNNGFTYQVLVPPNSTALRMVVQANNVHVADQSNHFVDAAAPSVLSTGISDLTQVIHYQVLPLTAVNSTVP